LRADSHTFKKGLAHNVLISVMKVTAFELMYHLRISRNIASLMLAELDWAVHTPLLAACVHLGVDDSTRNWGLAEPPLVVVQKQSALPTIFHNCRTIVLRKLHLVIEAIMTTI
jgi:hypothetical protein